MAIVTGFNPYPKTKTIALRDGAAAKAYLTTASAGYIVGRQRVPGVTQTVDGKTTHAPAAGAVVWLTDLQAEYELAQGHVTLLDPQPKSNSKEDVVAAAIAQQGQPAAAAPASPAAPASAPSAPAPAASN
jgi:hypothetical protein